MEHINEHLRKHLQIMMPWDNFLNNSNTQKDERDYIKIISEVIEKMGGRIGSHAPSQQSKDIRNVIFPSAPFPVTYECKKSKSHYMLNDTVPNEGDNYYYIFINTKNKSIIIKHCKFMISTKYKYKKENIESIKKIYEDTMELIEHAVIEGKITYYEYGQLLKRTIKFPNGLKSRPRPNWSISLQHHE